ncbi:hypothetical protein QTP88_010611 [Uroleucon formosanum]
MNNAPYHSMLVNNYPKCNARKAEVQEWLKNQNINFLPFETLAELRERVNLLKPTFKKYELDEIASSMGHEVVRLPPYHCQYNPIELIWAQVKGEVAKNNSTFKMVDVERLTHEALDLVSKSDWEKCVKHAETIQDEDYQEILIDSVLEPVIITFQTDDSDFSNDEDIWTEQVKSGVYRFPFVFEVLSPGMIVAIRDSFGYSTEIKGCLFHFGQSIWCRVQKVGLAHEYTQNDEVKKTVRRICALALVPTGKIDECWSMIHAEAPVNENLMKLMDYFVDTYLNNDAC